MMSVVFETPLTSNKISYLVDYLEKGNIKKPKYKKLMKKDTITRML